nr:acylphosphatase [Nanoarchaeota archaeon]
MKRIHFFVSGDVHGVCYRYYAVNKARKLGLKGFVRNVPDGRVEVLVEGEDNKVDEFMSFCKKDPGYSRVEKQEVKEEKEIKSSGFDGFEIRH